MVEPISAVRRVRAAAAFDTPRDAEPPAKAPPRPGPRSFGGGTGGLSALKAAPGAREGLRPMVTRIVGGPDSQRELPPLARPTLPTQRNGHLDQVIDVVSERSLPGHHAPAIDGPAAASALSEPGLPASPGMPERFALAQAAHVLQDVRRAAFDEAVFIAQVMPPSQPRPPSLAVGLALEWLAAGLTLPAMQRLERLSESGRVLRALEAQSALTAALRGLGLAPASIGLLHAAETDLAVRRTLRLGADLASLVDMGREMAQALRESSRTHHLLVLSGGSLPRAVACVREPDASYSVFDPARGLFAAVADTLQQVITGVAAAYELQQQRARLHAEKKEALALLRDVQLLELAVHGEDIDHDGIRDGGLI